MLATCLTPMSQLLSTIICNSLTRCWGAYWNCTSQNFKKIKSWNWNFIKFKALLHPISTHKWTLMQINSIINMNQDKFMELRQCNIESTQSSNPISNTISKSEIQEMKKWELTTWSKLCSAALRSSGLGLRAAWSITARLGRSITINLRSTMKWKWMRKINPRKRGFLSRV